MQISVSDRGRGIEAEDLAHIFEPFYRGRYALDRQIHGNGLGLSLVQRIAEAHGGRVTVKSRRARARRSRSHSARRRARGCAAGRGPIRRRPGPHRANRTLRRLMPAVATASKRVLLVEDEPGLVLTLTDRLKSEGYDVQAASDGPSGLERATRERWDVILLDVMLPGASGFDVCRDLRQRGVTTPVIMLTARGQVVDKVLGLKLGADDYLTKPFDMMELTARIEVQLRRRAAAASNDGDAVSVRRRRSWISARPR